MKRIYEEVLTNHFKMNQQMAFLCGPRQVGKTTISRSLQVKQKEASLYRSWDIPNDQHRMLSNTYEPLLEGLTLSPGTHPLLILDEIHKYPQWKNYLKGLYDTYQGQMDLLVTGSARLNIYQKGGDSLMGRYFIYRIHPLSIGELLGEFTRESTHDHSLLQAPHLVPQELMEDLLHFGGFPEPFLKKRENFRNQWQNLRRQQLIYEDIRSLEAIQNLAQLEMLSTILQYQAGQLVNYSSLASKIRVSVPTIQRWINVLEQVYYIFVVRPWTKNIPRSLIKEPKIYLYDWSLINDPGSKHENFIASHLIKFVHFWTDLGLGQFELYFIRTKDQDEVDFLITKNEKPWMLVEVKTSSQSPLSKSLRDFQVLLKCPLAFQVVFDLPLNLASHQRLLDWFHLSIKKREEDMVPATILPAATLLSMLRS